MDKKNIPTPKILLIQGTLHPISHTDILLTDTVRILCARNLPYTILDLRNPTIALYDCRSADEYGEATKKAVQCMENSDVFLFIVPAYAPQAPGTLKNLIELSSGNLSCKRAGLICYSETGANYEASLDLIKLLSAQNVEILRPVVSSTPETFRSGKIFDEIVSQLIEELVEAALTPSQRI